MGHAFSPPVIDLVSPSSFAGGHPHEQYRWLREPHFCLGASFARIETAALLRELLTRLPNLEAAGRAERLTSNFIAGPKRFPIRSAPQLPPAKHEKAAAGLARA